MCYTAKYPTDISACIIEDMDIRRRSVDSNYIQNFDEAKAIAFNRGHPTLNSLTRELESIGYTSDIYSKWIDEGRIYEDTSDGSKHKFWSGVNPAFRALCYRTIFDSNSGTDSWSKIATNMQREIDNGNEANIAKLHLMVAGIGTVCDEKSVEHMRKSFPEHTPLSVKTYAEGSHSIHNSVREDFLADLKQIINDARNMT